MANESGLLRSAGRASHAPAAIASSILCHGGNLLLLLPKLVHSCTNARQVADVVPFRLLLKCTLNSSL